MFHELVVDRGDISLECFIRVNQKYRMWQGENILLSMSSLTRSHTRKTRNACVVIISMVVSVYLICNSYMFICLLFDVSLQVIVFKTAPLQVLQHANNNGCVSLSVGDELGSLALDHFELSDYVFNVWVPGRTGNAYI